LDKVNTLDGDDRLREIVKVMNDLLYEASIQKLEDGTRIQATNCVYHALAAKFSDICQFDLSLLSVLSGKTAVQEKCIVRGDRCCQFSFKEKP
jgi:predicted ArsR family transcriptional regulator